MKRGDRMKLRTIKIRVKDKKNRRRIQRKDERSKRVL